MDKQTKQLAEQAGFVLDELPDSVLQPLETFAELLRNTNTREVVILCAKTINTNLLETQRKSKQWFEYLEFGIIIVLLIAWGAWWYAQLHT